MRSGRRLAIDVGKARIGVAVSDFHGILASPVGFVQREASVDESVRSWLQFVSAHQEELGVEFLELYVGLPINLKGQTTESTQDALAIGRAFASSSNLEPRFLDERLTTVSALSNLRSAGKDARKSKGLVDAAAATLILETALAAEKSTGQKPGLSEAEVELLCN